MKKILIFATCHSNVITRLLRSSMSCGKRYTVQSILNFTSPGVAADPTVHYSEICESDLFLYQYNKQITPDFLAGIGKYTRTVKIPYVTSSIYWPSMVKPANGTKLLSSEKNPFGIIPFRCSLLDNLIPKCRSDDEIVQQYSSLDMSDVINIESNYLSQIEYLKKLDLDNPDIKIANYVEDKITKSQLFYLFNHPSIEVFRHIAKQLFELIDIQDDLPDNIPDMFYYHQLPTEFVNDFETPRSRI